MKKKWRHIRDCFTRYLNQGKSGSAAPEKKKKYVYADALTFLMSTMEKRPTSGNISEYVENDVEEETPAEVEARDEVHQETEQPPRARKTPRNNGMKCSAFQSELLSQLSRSTKAEEDPDRLYILSLLNDYKKLNEDQKLDFKLMNLQFFRSIRQHKLMEITPHTVQPQQSWSQLPTSGQPIPPEQAWNQKYFIPQPGSSHQFTEHHLLPNQSPHSQSPHDSIFSCNSEG